MPFYLWPMTSLRPVLARYRLVRFGPYTCLSSMYVQNLLAAHMSAVVGLHCLPSRIGPCLMVDFAFSLAHPSSCHYLLPYHSIIPAAKLFCFKLVLLQTGWASLGLSFILPLMAQQGHWFLCYIISGFPCPICFPLGFLGPFPNYALPWAFIEFFGLSWPNYIIPHP